MRRALPIAAFLLVAVPSAASAAPFGELPFRPAGGAATCLRATGYPGELVRSTRTGAQFLQATPTGLVPVASVNRTDQTSACPEAAARPNGVGVVAFKTSSESGGGNAVQVALREPGGGWGAPAAVASVEQSPDGHALAADVSERGDALVAFADGEPKRWKIRAVRRTPGGAFAAPVTVSAAGKGASSSIRVAAGLSATGEAVVAWSFQPKAGNAREVWAAIAAAGAGFSTPARIGTLRTSAGFSLAVGAGGHALVAFPAGDDLLVAERAPGGGFGPAARVGPAKDRLVVYPTAAVRPDGGAVVAWQNALSGDVQAVIRSQPGPFSAPLTLAARSGLRYPKLILDVFDAFADDDFGEATSDAASPDDDGSFPRATITPDGRAVVTSAGVGRRDGMWFGAPRVSTVPLTGGTPESQFVGAGLREPGSITPIVTAETAGIAWADNNSQHDGRLHLALEGVAGAADPAGPDVRVLGARHRVLEPDDALGVTVRCAAACDVRVQLGEGIVAPSESLSLTRAGERRIELYGLYKPLATLKGGPVKLHLRYGAPGARRATEKTLTFDLRRLPDAPRPRVLAAVARRVDKEIVVTWRSDREAKPTNFAVYSSSTRSDDPFTTVLLGSGIDDFGDSGVTGNGRQFSARLGDDVDEARYVKIVAHVKGARKYETTTVRVRG